MAHKKGVGSSKNGRDSNGQRRGTKVYGGQNVTAGSIIVRQLGTPIRAGENVGTGTDWTLFAKIDGVVTYERVGRTGKRVSVYPQDNPEAHHRLRCWSPHLIVVPVHLPVFRSESAGLQFDHEVKADGW